MISAMTAWKFIMLRTCRCISNDYKLNLKRCTEIQRDNSHVCNWIFFCNLQKRNRWKRMHEKKYMRSSDGAFKGRRTRGRIIASLAHVKKFLYFYTNFYIIILQRFWDTMFINFRPQQGNNSALNSEYLEALEFGQKNYDCSLIYESCLSGQGILDQISKVIS